MLLQFNCQSVAGFLSNAIFLHFHHFGEKEITALSSHLVIPGLLDRGDFFKGECLKFLAVLFFNLVVSKPLHHSLFRYNLLIWVLSF